MKKITKNTGLNKEITPNKEITKFVKESKKKFGPVYSKLREY